MGEVRNDAWLDAKEGDDRDKAERDATGDRPAPKEQNLSRNNRGFHYPIKEKD